MRNAIRNAITSKEFQVGTTAFHQLMIALFSDLMESLLKSSLINKDSANLAQTLCLIALIVQWTKENSLVSHAKEFLKI